MGNSSEGSFHSYPSFLWITWCKIVGFISVTRFRKPVAIVAQLDYRQPKSDSIREFNGQRNIRKVTLQPLAHNCAFV